MASISRDVLVRPGTTPHLDRRDPSSMLGLTGGKARGRLRAQRIVGRIGELQERLWAERRRSLLVVLQGVDASGKDGASRRLLTGLNPQGVAVHSFGPPAGDELLHDFLWRIHARAPRAGCIGLFNRSHYEDIVTAQLRGTIDAREAERRIHSVNAFERHLVEQGTSVLKVFLHISKDEQRERLQERIDQPEKRWKVAPSDLADREHWDEAHRLWERVISSTSTEPAPWHVLPADRKWVRDVALAELAQGALERIDPQFPSADESQEITVA